MVPVAFGLPLRQTRRCAARGPGDPGESTRARSVSDQARRHSGTAPRCARRGARAPRRHHHGKGRSPSCRGQACLTHRPAGPVIRTPQHRPRTPCHAPDRVSNVAAPSCAPPRRAARRARRAAPRHTTCAPCCRGPGTRVLCRYQHDQGQPASRRGQACLTRAGPPGPGTTVPHLQPAHALATVGRQRGTRVGAGCARPRWPGAPGRRHAQ